ncbi:hypothetical protein DL93DRAFT_2109316 [Clavulina sp. PMI_390]|nr:hypothetical protein DL93DRAFT_2109316 [Clavulina sp. PMI_390]
MVHAKNVERRDSLSDGLKSVKEWTSGMSKAVSIEIQRAYVMFANAYLALPEASRTCYAITTVNALIFLAWKVPRWQTFMMRHFLHDPLSGRSYTLLTSVFSHQSFPHLLFNSLALNSFGAAFDVVDSQRPDVLHMAHSTNRWHFLGFYLGAGLFASTLSHVVSTRIVLPRLLKALADPAKASALKPNEAMISPSLGASGAIYGVVAMTALALPETNISLIFLPMVPFPITFGVGGMVALDIIGIIRGWKMFDHWAHLGGALSGAIYFYHAPWEWVRAKLWPLRV